MRLRLFFFFNDTATTEIYTLSLHDALPIFGCPCLLLPGSHDLDRKPHQPRDQRQPKRTVGLPLCGALTRPLQGEVMSRHGIERLGQGAQALRAPDPLLVTFIEQTGQHPTGARDVAYQTEPGEELEPVQGEENVT